MSLARQDAVIVGGGLTGLGLAAALGGAGLTVAVVDREPPAATLAAGYDGRASAIALGGQRVLAALGVWQRLAGQAQPITDIRVSDGALGQPAAPHFLHYALAELGGTSPAMGYIVENRWLRQALEERLAELPQVTLLRPARALKADCGAAAATLELEDGRRLVAALVVAADGKASPLRRAAGIRTLDWRYDQVGLVATLAHERPHGGTAHEHFLPSGPFAVLPMVDGPDESGAPCHRSSLVWTERRALAPAMLALSDEAFAAALQRRFGDSLGRLRPLGGRWSYELELLLAERFVAPRLALVGEAAHVIHPIAGQGLNLGLRDIAALAEAVVDQRRLGLDCGAPEALARYQRWRRFDTLALAAVTDLLNRLFSNDLAPLRLARDLGLAAVERAPSLKRLFMRHAMGLVGTLPRLVKGEAL